MQFSGEKFSSAFSRKISSAFIEETSPGLLGQRLQEEGDPSQTPSPPPPTLRKPLLHPPPEDWGDCAPRPPV